MTRVLLLGLGRWGVNHLRNLNAMSVELYVAEVDRKRLDPARKLGLPETHLFTNYRECLDKVEAVVVVTPAQTHFPVCQEILEAGKDVFVEKPITLTSAEAKQLTELAQKRQRILQVGHIFRFDPASQWLRDAIRDSGHIVDCAFDSAAGSVSEDQNDFRTRSRAPKLHAAQHVIIDHVAGDSPYECVANAGVENDLCGHA